MAKRNHFFGENCRPFYDASYTLFDGKTQEVQVHHGGGV
jgi:hypothetical protein